LDYKSEKISLFQLAAFVFVCIFSCFAAVAEQPRFPSIIPPTSNKSASPAIASAQTTFGRIQRRKRIAKRTGRVRKKPSTSRLNTVAPQKLYRRSRQNTSKTAARMNDKNTDKTTQENDASTKTEAKKAGTFDGDLRNLPPVKPVRQERPKRKDPPTKPRVLITPPENPEKN
jgi:hypothetical protein